MGSGMVANERVDVNKLLTEADKISIKMKRSITRDASEITDTNLEDSCFLENQPQSLKEISVQTRFLGGRVAGCYLVMFSLFFLFACGTKTTSEDRKKVGHDLGLALVLSQRLSNVTDDQDSCSSLAAKLKEAGSQESSELPREIPNSNWSDVEERDENGACTFTVSMVTPGWDRKSAERRFKVLAEKSGGQSFVRFKFGGRDGKGEGLTEIVPSFSLEQNPRPSDEWFLKVLNPAIYPADEKTITLRSLGQKEGGIPFPARKNLKNLVVVIEPQNKDPLTLGDLWRDCHPGRLRQTMEFINPFDSVRTFGFVAMMLLLAVHALLVGTFSWRHVKKVTKFLNEEFPSKISDKDTLKKADRAFERLGEEHPALAMRWDEFRECVLENENPPVNSEDAATFIGEEHFALEGRLFPSDSYLQSVPGILTSLGILGTFVGLVAGLTDFSVGTADQVQVSIGVLIGGLSTAFRTSIWGVGLAIIVTFFLRIQLAGREKRISDLLSLIDGAFRKLTPEAILQKNLETRQGMVIDLERAMTSGNEVRKKLATSTLEMEQTLKSLSGDLANALQTAIDQGFSQHLAAPFQDIMERLGSTMNQEQQGHNERITEIISSVDAMQHGSQEVLSNLERMSIQQNVALDRVTQVITSTEGLPGALKPAVDRIEYAATKLEELSGSLVQHQTAALEAGSLQADLAVSVEKQIRTLNDVAGKTFGDLQASLQNTAGVLGQIQTTFGEQTTAVQSAMQATSVELRGSAEAMHVARANLVNVGETLNSAPKQLQSILEKFSATAEGLDSIIQLTARVADKFNTSLPEFSKASSNLVLSSSSVLQSTKELSRSVNGTLVVVDGLRQGMENLNESNTEVRRFWLESSQSLKSVAHQMEIVQKGLVAWLGEYSKQWQTYMGKTLEQLDTHLGRAVTNLSRQISETSNIVEELQEWADKLRPRDS